MLALVAGPTWSRMTLTGRRQPLHGTAEAVVLGEITIDRYTVDLVVADDRLNELITAMRNVGTLLPDFQ
jgi:hypothetical protein